jgi:hypothetical protein
MPSVVPRHEIEDHIRREFRAAFEELERAEEKQKADAAARLNRAVRRLYDFIGSGKVPQDFSLRRSG